MSLIVAARFESFEAAENAGRALLREQFPENSVSIFYVNPAGAHAKYPLGGDEATDAAARESPGGAMLGAVSIGLVGLLFGGAAYLIAGTSIFIVIIATCIGAYIGSLLGALMATQRAKANDRPGETAGFRHAGVLVAVHVHAGSEACAARILSTLGGKDVEQASGRWRDGKWVDFDPVHAPVLSDKVSSTHPG